MDDHEGGQRIGDWLQEYYHGLGEAIDDMAEDQENTDLGSYDFADYMILATLHAARIGTFVLLQIPGLRPSKTPPRSDTSDE